MGPFPSPSGGNLIRDQPEASKPEKLMGSSVTFTTTYYHLSYPTLLICSSELRATTKSQYPVYLTERRNNRKEEQDKRKEEEKETEEEG